MIQQQMAEYLEISERYYKQIEAGQRTGDFTLWDEMEDLLGIHQRILREISENHPDKANSQGQSQQILGTTPDGNVGKATRTLYKKIC